MQRILISALPAAMLIASIAIAIGHGLHGFLGYASVLVGVVALVLFLVGIVEAIAEVRNYRLSRRRPTALLLPSVQSDELVEAVQLLSQLEGFRIAPPPFSLSLLIDESGIELWTGVISLSRYARWTWDTVRSASFTRFRKQNWRGLQLGIAAGDRVVHLSFPIFGAGPLGAYTLSEGRLQAILDQRFPEVRSRST